VLAEPVALEQIIHNLLMNALQALEEVPAANRQLQVALHSDTDQGRLSLCDNGPGIPVEVLPRIFEPFFTTRTGGLGLGLSLCETLATGMGGALTARNRASGGAEFCLSLPRALTACRAA
jgi:C4-dicarboxylate-specific signal transduction histidine kinase